MARNKAKHPLRELRRVIIYIRVSMERDVMQSDIMQKKSGENVASFFGVQVVDVVYDIDETGTTFDNRKILGLIERVRYNEADGIIVLDTSRWGRNSEESQRHEKMLREAGGVLIASGRIIDTSTSEGRMAFVFNTAVDENFAIKIGEGWVRAHENRIERGLAHHGKPNFGYSRCPKCTRNPINMRSFLYCENCKGVPQVSEPSGSALAEAFKRYVDDEESFQSIAISMAARGIRSNASKKYPQGKRMTGANWRNAMDTGFAAGLLRVGVNEDGNDPWAWESWGRGRHKALIELDLWERYVARRKKQADPSRRSQMPKRSVSGLMRCGATRPNGETCLASMTSGTHGRQDQRESGLSTAFQCTRRQHEGAESCPGVSVRLNRIEAFILQWIDAHANGEEAVFAEMQRMAKDNGERVILRELEDKRRKLKQQAEDLVDMVLQGDIPRDAGRKKTKEIQEDLSVIEQRIAIVGEAVRTAAAPPPEAFQNFRAIWPKMVVEKQRQALGMVIDHVLVIKTEGKKRNLLEIVPAWAPLSDRIKRRVDWGKLAEERAAA